MPYPAIISRRIPYDIDGTEVGYNRSLDFYGGIVSWCSSAIKAQINLGGYKLARSAWFFFPEKMEIEAVYVSVVKDYIYDPRAVGIQGSNDTTNGLDGTWEQAIIVGTWYEVDTSPEGFRTKIGSVSFSEPKRAIRINASTSPDGTQGALNIVHLYGRKAMEGTPNDILICDTNGNELTKLMDWGDRPEATEQMKSIKLKNASTTKTANGVNLQLNHADFGMSFNVAGSWTATLDIANIPPNGLSEPIYIKNTVGLPPQTLGPKAGRLIVGVGSWT